MTEVITNQSLRLYKSIDPLIGSYHNTTAEHYDHQKF